MFLKFVINFLFMIYRNTYQTSIKSEAALQPCNNCDYRYLNMKHRIICGNLARKSDTFAMLSASRYTTISVEPIKRCGRKFGNSMKFILALVVTSRLCINCLHPIKLEFDWRKNILLWSGGRGRGQKCESVAARRPASRWPRRIAT